MSTSADVVSTIKSIASDTFYEDTNAPFSQRLRTFADKCEAAYPLPRQATSDDIAEGNARGARLVASAMRACASTIETVENPRQTAEDALSAAGSSLGLAAHAARTFATELATNLQLQG